MYSSFYEGWFGRSNFYNWGYWTETTKNAHEACEQLTERLLSFLSEKKGPILDVACGKGATTRHLLRYYKPSEVTGITISDKQIQTCRNTAPGATFYQMDATRMSFDNEQFQAVMCVESIFHFNTKEDFLRQAYGILKPGGYLILTDLLFRGAVFSNETFHFRENNPPSITAYEALYKKIGFSEVEIADCTAQCWKAYRNHMLGYIFTKARSGKLDLLARCNEIALLLKMQLFLKHYVLVAAKK